MTCKYSGCTGLTAVNIPNSVNSIGDDAFSRCNTLTSITIPGSVKSIGNNAFYRCSGLTSAVIYDGVISLGNFVFAYCSNLSSVTISNSVESIGSYAFENTPWLNSQPEGIVYVGKVAYMYKGYMPSNTSVVLKEGTTTLQSNTFERCGGLTSISIPASLTNIGINAFRDCTSLATIIVDGANSRYDSRENCNAIIETSNNSLIAGCKNTVIPNSVTSIGNNAFYNCSGLTSLTIPGGVTSIGSGAFNNCNGLVSIVVEAGNSKYDSRENCNAIIESSTNSLLVGCKNTVIPNSVTSIGENVFYNCSGLTSISIPSGMKRIGYCSICGCSDLTDVYCYAEKLPTTDKGTFDGVENNTVLHVPASAIETYRTTAPWSRFKEVVAIEETAIKHELSFDILADAKESYAVQNAVESENPIASYNAEAEANQAPEFFFNRPAYNAYSPEVRPYRVVYTWREGNPAIRGAGDNSTDAMIPEGDNTDVKDFFDFWYSANAEATAEANDWVKFNEADKNGFLVPNVNTQSMRAAIKENVANRLIDGATYKVTMSIQRQDGESVWTTVNTYDIDITKVMPTAMPAEFGVRPFQLDNGVWPFYLRPYAGVEYGETATDSPWKISWNDGDGQAPAEHDCRWGVDARPYDFKELFTGLILPEEDNIDKNYYFVFKESGDFAAADVDATEASDGQYKDADAIAVYTEDVDGGYYRLPKIHWSHLGESKNVEAGYIYRGISAKLDETGKQFLNPQDVQDGLSMEIQDYAIDPVPVMAGSQQFVASFSCALDAAVVMTDDETKNIFEYNENVYCKATDAKFKLKNKYWYVSGYSQAYFNTQFPATWTDAEGGVGTLTDLIAAPYFSVDMTSLKCNVTSPAGYNYRDYYYEPYFAKSDGTKANSFNEIANICMMIRGASFGNPDIKTNIEGTFTFDIYDIWFHSRTVTVNFKIKRPTNNPDGGIPGDTGWYTLIGKKLTLNGSPRGEYMILQADGYLVWSNKADGNLTIKTNIDPEDSNTLLFDGQSDKYQKITVLEDNSVQLLDGDGIRRTLTITDATAPTPTTGSTFKALTSEGVEMLFQILSASDMTCRVGIGSAPAVSQNTEGVVTIPSVVNGYTVTKIANRAFKECTKLTQVIIPNTVTDIGTTDFESAMGPFHGCSGITSFDIPSSVTTVGRGAFTRCTKVTELVIPESVTVIGSNAFDYCSGLKSIVLSPFITSIQLETFRGCTSLESIEVPGSVNSIGYNAFQNCNRLKTITSYIENPFTFPQSAFTSYTATLYVPMGTKEKYQGTSYWNRFPTIEEFDDEADALSFTSSKGLTYTVIGRTSTVSVKAASTELTGEVVIPEVVMNSGKRYTVVTIKTGGFEGCTGMEKLTIAKTVTNIGTGAFAGCTNLTTLDVTAGSPYTSVDGVLYAEYMTRLVAFPAGRGGEFELPKSVTAVSDGAFAGCSKLTSLTATQGKPIALKTDGGVFDGMDFDACELHVPLGSGADYRRAEGWKQFLHIIDDSEVQVAGITYSIGENGTLTQTGADGVLTVGDYTVPSTVTIDGTEYAVTGIAPNAFENCTGMTSLTIPESITSIGDHAFAGCTGLEEIYCYSAVPIDLSTMFARGLVRTASGTVPTQLEGIDFENCILYVPFGTSGLYREAEGWCLFRNIHELPVGELSMGDVNCDTAVDNLDVNLIGSFVAGQFPSPFVWDAADINHDGQVDIVDVTALIQMLLDKKP